ncbi:MAG: hypothetical protein L7U83_07000 [Akkermansiaceae bacterium]|nr:hypothetical protein [Akkermansiaceae bacterium]
MAVLFSACNKEIDVSGVNEEVSEKLTSHDDILTQYFEAFRGHMVSMKTVVDLKTASAYSVELEGLLEKVSSLSAAAKKLGEPSDVERDELKKKFSRQWKILEAENKGKSLWLTPKIATLIEEAEKEHPFDAQDIFIETYSFLRPGYDLNKIVIAFSDADNLPTEIPLSSNDVQLILAELVSDEVKKDIIARPI